MQETLHDHHTFISIGGRRICNLRFANNISLNGGSNGKLQDLTNRLVDRATASGMEVITEESKIMINSMNNISADISMNGQKLEEMTSFKNLGATLCKDGTCSAKVCIRISSATATVTRLHCISYLEHNTNDWVRSMIKFLVGKQEPLLATVNRRRFAWFGHVTGHDSLFKTILQGTLEDGRCRGRQKKCWMDNIKERTSLPMP